MLFSTWLRNYKCSLENRSSRKQTRRCRPAIRRVAPRPRLEALEDRTLLSALAGVGAIGDSYTDEYQFGARSSARNWVEQLAEYRGVNFGTFSTNSWGDIRGPGYEYNWATGSATNYDQQVAGLAGQVATGQVTTAAVMGGIIPELTPGDPSTVFSYLNEVYSGTLTGDALSSVLDANVAQRVNAMDTLTAAGHVQLVVADYANFADSPQGRQTFTDPAGRQRLQDADNTLNARLEAAAAARGIPVVDIAALGFDIDQQAAIGQPIVIGGFNMDTTDYSSTNPADVFADSQHFGSVAQGLLANMFIYAVDLAYGADIAPFSDQELLANAGLTAPNSGPTYTGFGELVIYPRPTITALSAAYVTAGSPDLPLTVTGNNFSSDMVVAFNGSALPTTFVNSTTLQTTIPATDLANAGNANIAVSIPGTAVQSGGFGIGIYPPGLPSMAITDFGVHSRDNSGNLRAPVGTSITLGGLWADTDFNLAGFDSYSLTWSVSRNGSLFPGDPIQGFNGFNDPGIPNFTFTPTVNGTYVVTLTGTDVHGGGQASDSVTIDVAPAVSIQGTGSLATTGSLDPSFGTGGQSVTSLGTFGTGGDYFSAVATQTDGKIVAVGGTGANFNEILLARYNTDGSLDTAFGNGGYASTTVPNGGYLHWINTVAIDSQGRIVVAGSMQATDGSIQPFLARYLSNGTLDTNPTTGFGPLDPAMGSRTGIVFLSTGMSTPNSIAIDGSDQILVAGQVVPVVYSSGDWTSQLVRITTSGALDTTFGNTGTGVQTIQEAPNGIFVNLGSGISDLTNPPSPPVVTIDGQGRILLGQMEVVGPPQDIVPGTTTNYASKVGYGDESQSVNYYKTELEVACYNSDGNLDPTFGSAGIATMDVGSEAGSAGLYFGEGQGFGLQSTRNIFGIAADNQGGSVIETETNTGLAELVRLTSSGALDTNATTGFGPLDPATGSHMGIVITPIFTQNEFAVQPDGRIIIMGSLTNTSTFSIQTSGWGVARYNPDGSPDSSFGPGGVAQIGMPSANSIQGITAESNGNILLVGYQSPDGGNTLNFLREQVIGASPQSPVGVTLSFTSTVNDPNPSPMYQWTVTKDGSSYVLPDSTMANSADFSFTPNAIANYVVTLSVTDPDLTTVSDSKTIVVTSLTTPSLQQILPQNVGSTNAVTIEASANVTEDDVIAAVNSLTAPQQPVAITLDLNGGTFDDTTVDPPANVTLVINGASGTNTFVGHSPAFIVTGGNVIVTNVTFSTPTDAPTILVTGGSLALRNDVIQESTGFSDAAISITGGTLDLGTASGPGGNTLNLNGSGEFVHNTTTNPISAVGDTFSANGTPQTASTLSFTSLTASATTAVLHQPVTFTATVRPDGTGTPSGSVDFVDTMTNTDLGSVVLSGGTATRTTTALTAGNHIIQARYSGDGTFFSSLDSIAVGVQYNFSGFLPPLSNGLGFAVNRTIPIQFQLTDANGKVVTSLSAVTSLQIVPIVNGVPGTTFTPASTNNQGLQYTGGQYQFNWQTKGLSAGSYEIVLTLNDGSAPYTKTIQLTAGGKSAGLVTDGSGGTASAGALLGGEVDLYVDNSNGDLTSDDLARINDAVTSIDATIAPYGVTIVEVSDPTQANVTLNMNTTSSLGGLSQGVLGCTTDADQVTMIQGWNWYAGSDLTQVGSGQYDFETAVIHELGHVLGLGHSSDSNSVMYSTLTAGTANRTLVAADLNVPDDGGPCALHAVPIASVASKSNGQGMTAPSSTSVPSSGSPLSAVDQVFANLALLLSEVRNAYQSELSSVTVMWHTVDALALQRLDALLSLEAGVMGISKGILTRDRFFVSTSSPNG